MNRTLLATAFLALALSGCNNSERAKADAERAKAEAEKAKAELELAKLKAAGPQRQAEPFPNKPNGLDGNKDPIQGKGPQTKSDMDAIQGTWTVAASELGGIPQQAQVLAAQSYVIAGGKLKLLEDGVLISTTSFTLNPAKSPKQIDIKLDDGTTELGIYELNGDVLKICSAPKKRPGSFAASGSDISMSVLKRKTGTNKGTTKSDKDAIQGTWALVSGELRGKPEMVIEDANFTYTFAGGKLKVLIRGELDSTASITFNSAKSPKQIDLKWEEDGFTALGIYELNGDDLKICTGLKRPGSFATSGSDNHTRVFKRK